MSTASAAAGGAAEGALQIFGLGWLPQVINPNGIVDRSGLDQLQTSFKDEQDKFQRELQEAKEKEESEDMQFLAVQMKEMGTILEEDNIQLSESQELTSYAQMALFVIVMFIFLYLLFA